MFDEGKFKKALATSGLSLADAARILGVDQSTLYRKMRGISDFTRNEIQMIKNAVNLTTQDIDNIFFAEQLA